MNSERLVVLSDMWGPKKGMWITSYLAYLQQYYEIEYYDIQQLANVDLLKQTEKNIHTAFVEGGIDTAVSHLLKKETKPAHYLAFSMGGSIAWKANLKGLPMKSLYAVSATRVRKEVERVDGDVKMLFGSKDLYRPSTKWSETIGVELEVVENFGHEMYSDSQVIQKVCLDLLKKVMVKPEQEKKTAKIKVLAKKIS
ncbi:MULTISPECIES: hypothetical protein [unclassified Cellulophaga]|uniref:hypothetical protein n=1 Tax=unclassified Cellulophaga TaxID=2634405 RepID=UPI0026E1A9A7|nr:MULTISPECIES: hypothetical protein [unclassified Cellulophaga]MDO6490345.1 hypothetical protein [Cellulophaga sp. 2_MG-2023]MDO6494461.1 hypothetical protein [Cellulophaga sp. 3_MG-2023]